MEVNNEIAVLIKQFNSGNKESFVKLINLVQEPVYKIIFAIINNKENSLEVFDDVVYKAYTNLHTLKNLEFFKTWIIRIAINESRNFIKKNSKIVYMEEYEKKEYIQNNIEDKLDFETALNKLDVEIKSVIIMKCYMNFKFEEIAISLDKPVSTIKTWYYKGLDRLKEMLNLQEEVTKHE